MAELCIYTPLHTHTSVFAFKLMHFFGGPYNFGKVFLLAACASVCVCVCTFIIRSWVSVGSPWLGILKRSHYTYKSFNLIFETILVFFSVRRGCWSTLPQQLSSPSATLRGAISPLSCYPLLYRLSVCLSFNNWHSAASNFIFSLTPARSFFFPSFISGRPLIAASSALTTRYLQLTGRGVNEEVSERGRWIKIVKLSVNSLFFPPTCLSANVGFALSPLFASFYVSLFFSFFLTTDFPLKLNWKNCDFHGWLITSKWKKVNETKLQKIYLSIELLFLGGGARASESFVRLFLENFQSREWSGCTMGELWGIYRQKLE